MFNKLLQLTLVQHGCSRFMGWVANCRWLWLKNSLIKWFIARYQVDLSEAEHQDLIVYPHFNAFFTRALKPAARSIVTAENAIACPVDGTISQLGFISEGNIFQAKNQTYSLKQLLADVPPYTELFYNGHFATFYLAPKDYHRVHMPLTGQLQEMWYVPGQLFSVNAKAAQTVPQLFARNERLVCTFETKAGTMVLILVGAMLVAGIQTIWSGLVVPSREKKLQTWNYGPNEIALQKGQEMGHFEFGSTVIVLFQQERMQWHKELMEGSVVRMGQEIAQLN